MIYESDDSPQCSPSNAEWDSRKMFHRRADSDRRPSSRPCIRYTRHVSSCVLPMMTKQTFEYRRCRAFPHLQSGNLKRKKLKIIQHDAARIHSRKSFRLLEDSGNF
jgi:hypothetical protein